MPVVTMKNLFYIGSAGLYEPLLNDLYATSQIVGLWEDVLRDDDAVIRFEWEEICDSVCDGAAPFSPLLFSQRLCTVQFWPDLVSVQHLTLCVRLQHQLHCNG